MNRARPRTSWLLVLALTAACGSDGEGSSGAGATAKSASGKKFAAICDNTFGDVSGSCSEYFSDAPDFEIPYVQACIEKTKRCPTAKAVGTCVESREEREVGEFDVHTTYYTSADYWEASCLDDGGEWVTD